MFTIFAMKTALAHKTLESLCEVRNESSSVIGKENPLTPRVLFIIETLIDLKLHNKAKLNSDIFDDINDKEGKLKYVNIELTIEGNDTENSIMFTAHHDVNNPNSDN